MASPAQQLADILRDALISALQDREAELTAIAEAGGSKAGTDLFGDVGSLVGIFSDIVGAVPVLGTLFDLPLEPLKAVEGAAGKSGLAVGIGYTLGYAAWNAIQPVLEPLNHAVAALVQTELFDAQTAAQMVSMGIMPLEAGASEAAGDNFDGTHFNMMIDAAGNRPSFDVAAEMLRRGLIQQSDFATALARHNIPQYWWDAYQGLVRILLSPADLALANLRGTLPLDEATAYAAQLGLLETDFQTLIANTGEPPGTEMMMEALRRGFIDQPTFERAVLQSRVRDEWIPTLLQLQFTPMSTADAVRAVVENYLTSDQGLAIATQNGLEPEHWPYMVESWGRPLAHEQMRSLVNQGVATRDEFDQAMRESDLKDKYIDQAFAVGRRLVPERLTITMLQHGVINDATAFTMLSELGYTDDDIASLVNLGMSEHATTHKALTKADIITMYEDSLIPRDQAVTRLEALGYSTADANDEIDLADAKAHAAAIRTVKAGIEASLKAHHTTSDQAIIDLTNAGIDHAQASNLVDQWLEQRGTPTRGLTEAQVIRLAEHTIITPQDALTRLTALGLIQADAKLLLESYVGPF